MNPSISELMSVVEDWWAKEIDPANKNCASFRVVSDLLIRKGIAQDEDVSKNILEKYLVDKPTKAKEALIAKDDFY